jgi:peptidoglycan hydrolase-like protein with peptidoglycan-binding domain
LQRTLGVTPDGIIGPETLKAAAKAGLNWVGNLIKDNPAVATKAVLSALGLGGTPVPNQEPQEPANPANKPNSVEQFFKDS